MSVTTSHRWATYKGRKYRLLFLGKTKYGMKAKLAFGDLSKEFWVDADKVSELVGSSRSESGYCYYPCPVTGLKCCPENGPCHDCA